VCQKPFCGNHTDAKAICKKISASQSTVVVHENFRFQPWYQAIKTELNNGSLGTVLQATFRLRPGDGQGPDAYLERQPYFRDMKNFLIHETGVHFIDVFRYLFGEPQTLSADLSSLALYGNGDLLHRLPGDTEWQTITYPFDDNDFGGDCVFLMQNHIVDHLKKNTPLQNTVADYLKNLQLEELIYESAKTHTRLDCAHE